MKTKTLFVTLFAGAFLCFSNASYAQFHNSSSSHSSSSSSSGGGDDAFDDGNNIFDIGVGFAGGIGQYFNTIEAFSAGGGYTSSSTPGIRIDWEHAKNSHIGYGVIFEYQGASITDKYTDETETGFDPNTGFPIYTTTTSSDKYSLTFLTIAGRVAYHFTASPKFDPYIGITIGYVDASISYSSSDPGSLGFSGSATGVALGIQGGARYYFSDHIGAFGELAYCTNEGANIVNIGLTFKI